MSTDCSAGAICVSGVCTAEPPDAAAQPGPDASVPPDAGRPDAGTRDAGVVDSGSPRDAGIRDGCVPLAGCPAPYNCGTIDDGCGGSVDCGTCVGACGAQVPYLSCGGGGQANVCGCPAQYNVDNDKDGYTVCQGDCNDDDGTIHPCATEICDGKDDNCDGQVDEGFDTDADCFTTCGTNPACGSATSVSYDPGPKCGAVQSLSCAAAYAASTGACQPQGGNLDPKWVDCNDKDAFVHPLKTYDCGTSATSCQPNSGPGNNADDNCNGYVDETCNCSNTDMDGDGVTPCEGDCCDCDPTVYGGATPHPEICDGKDNDCNVNTKENCDVGQPCNWPAWTCNCPSQTPPPPPPEPSPDVCKPRLLCAQDVTTGTFACGSFCNTSQTAGGLGDGCQAGQSCSATLLFGYNDHLCTASGVTATAGAGTSCTQNSQCKSNVCTAYGVGAKATRACSDLCGNNKSYCSSNTTCQIAEQTAVIPPLTFINYYTGICVLNSQITGTGTTGANCAGNAGSCLYGALSCFNNTCAEPCCQNADCPSGYYCTLEGPALAQNITLTDSDGGVIGPAETSMPVCVKQGSGNGGRVAGQACSTNGDCVSNACDVNLKVCVDKCCYDADCPAGTQCDWVLVRKPDGNVEQMRVCVHTPDPPSLTLQ